MKEHRKQLIKTTNDFIIKQGVQTPIESLDDLLKCAIESQYFAELCPNRKVGIHNTIINLKEYLKDLEGFKQQERKLFLKKAKREVVEN